MRHVSRVCRGGWPRLPGAEKLPPPLRVHGCCTEGPRLLTKKRDSATCPARSNSSSRPLGERCRSLVQPVPSPADERMTDRSIARFASGKPRTLPAAASSRWRCSPCSCNRAIASSAPPPPIHTVMHEQWFSLPPWRPRACGRTRLCGHRATVARSCVRRAEVRARRAHPAPWYGVSDPRRARLHSETVNP